MFFGVAQARRARGTRRAREASRDDFDGADVEGETGGNGQGRQRQDGGANVRPTAGWSWSALYDSRQLFSSELPNELSSFFMKEA